MRSIGSNVIAAVTLPLGLVSLYSGWQIRSVPVVAGGVMGLCCVAAWLASRGWVLPGSGSPPRAAAPEVAIRPPARRKVIDASDTAALVEAMLAEGRFALLLRPQIAGNLSEDLFQQSLRALEQSMALVPDGEVPLGRGEEVARTIGVERFFLDRFPVTNRQFYEFVAAGGYEQVALWEPSILPALLDFVDCTGQPGPRYWKHGCYLPAEENHPVVGVSWYEACACARWLGKRLPSDAEWVKAGSWPVSVAPGECHKRKYPWGDTMDRSRANLWGSGPQRIVPVEQFAEGVSVGGVYQLIGNVWEWTSGNFRGGDHPAGELTLPVPLKSIRGGAFDTYFDNQATCQFQSGEHPLRRRHNIGFRCAVGVRDLQLGRLLTAGEEAAAAEPPATVKEVLA
jgi:iron(II)-dependent oxidoreductase